MLPLVMFRRVCHTHRENSDEIHRVVVIGPSLQCPPRPSINYPLMHPVRSFSSIIYLDMEFTLQSTPESFHSVYNMFYVGRLASLTCSLYLMPANRVQICSPAVRYGSP